MLSSGFGIVELRVSDDKDQFVLLNEHHVI